MVPVPKLELKVPSVGLAPLLPVESEVLETSLIKLKVTEEASVVETEKPARPGEAEEVTAEAELEPKCESLL